MFSIFVGVHQIQFASDFLEFPKASRLHSSGAAAGSGIRAHAQARAEPTQKDGRALARPAAKRTSKVATLIY